MLEIESINGSDSVNSAETDYPWGNAALKVKKEWALEQDMSLDIMTDAEAVEEHQKSQFRENFQLTQKYVHLEKSQFRENLAMIPLW